MRRRQKCASRRFKVSQPHPKHSLRWLTAPQLRTVCWSLCWARAPKKALSWRLCFPWLREDSICCPLALQRAMKTGHTRAFRAQPQAGRSLQSGALTCSKEVIFQPPITSQPDKTLLHLDHSGHPGRHMDVLNGLRVLQGVALRSPGRVDGRCRGGWLAAGASSGLVRVSGECGGVHAFTVPPEAGACQLQIGPS